MIAKSHNEREFTFGHLFQNLQHTGICRSGINHITGENYHIRLFGIKHLVYTFQRYIRGRIAIFKMYIGKLYYFKLTVFIKLQLALLSHTESS